MNVVLCLLVVFLQLCCKSSSSSMSAIARKYDIVLWGSTGFTGRLAAQYLSKEYGSKLRVAIAGRDAVKVNAIKEQFGLKDFDVLIADLEDKKSLEAMTSATTCIISTAGPFAKIGIPIVDACMKTTTNYVDITGEPQYVRQLIDSYHEEAMEKGIKIVQCCGRLCAPCAL